MANTATAHQQDPYHALEPGHEVLPRQTPTTAGCSVRSTAVTSPTATSSRVHGVPQARRVALDLPGRVVLRAVEAPVHALLDGAQQGAEQGRRRKRRPRHRKLLRLRQ